MQKKVFNSDKIQDIILTADKVLNKILLHW